MKPKTTLKQIREMAMRVMNGEALSHIAPEYGYAGGGRLCPSGFRQRVKRALNPAEYQRLDEVLRKNTWRSRFKPAVTGNWHPNEERIRAIRAMKGTEAAYVAGIIDGEGSLTLVHRKRNEMRGWESIEPHVRISNTNLELMKHLSVLLGARPYASHGRPKSHWKPQYTIGISAFAEIEALLERIIPYLVIKRRRAEIMLRLIRRRLAREPYTIADRELLEEFRRENRRGDARTRESPRWSSSSRMSRARSPTQTRRVSTRNKSGSSPPRSASIRLGA